MEQVLTETYKKETTSPDLFSIQQLESYIVSNSEVDIPTNFPFYQIIWYFEDGGQQFVERRAYDIEKNMVFFIAKDQSHHFDNNPKNGILISFDEDFLVKYKEDIDVFLRFNIFNNIHQPFCSIPANQENKLLTILKMIQQEERGNSISKDNILRNYLKILLLHFEEVKRSNQEQMLNAHDNDHYYYLKFRDLLETRYTQYHTVDKYAQELNISSRKLMELTKDIHGLSPSEIIKERIVLEAKRLLRHGKCSVKEIAFQLGFEDPSNFSKFFKKKSNTTPKLYREAFAKKYL